jgi:regulator of sigma E protease
MSYVIYPIAVLGILVFVHEFGHYAVAKLCGVRIEVFSLGFGKRLLGFTRGDTDYRISLLPIGGYVKMAGENPMEDRTGDPGEFMSHPRWQRFLIAIAGPAMNVLLAIAVLTGVYMNHFERPLYLDQPVDVGSVMPNSAGQRAGIQSGDRIIQAQGLQNPTWDQIAPSFFMSANQPMEITLQRNGQIVHTTLTPEAVGKEKAGDAGILPISPVIVAAVTKDMAADKAGMKPGDRITAINNAPIHNMVELIDTLQAVKDTPTPVKVVRQNQELSLTATPQMGEVEGKKRYVIGIGSEELKQVGKLSFPDAISRATLECKTNSILIFQLVGKMIQRKVDFKQVSGPIMIGKISGDAGKQKSWIPLFMVLAIISLNLAVFNLFPIPILDGGLMLMLLIESIMRRDIKQQVKERVYQAAFVFLVLFAAVVIFNDVAKTLPGS